MFFFFFQAEDGIRDGHVTGVQTCALPIYALSPISRPRLVHLLGCRGGGLQGDGRYPAQACWYAQIGRASCRERVEIAVGAVLLKKKRMKEWESVARLGCNAVGELIGHECV